MFKQRLMMTLILIPLVIVGIIYAKDLLTVSFDKHHIHVHEYARKPVFIPEFKNIEDLFQGKLLLLFS